MEVGGSSTTESDAIADYVSNYFKETPMKLHRDLPKPDNDFGLKILENKNILNNFSEVTENEILVIMSELKNSSPLSDIPSKFLKLCSPYLVPILCRLFNEYISQGYFPRIFKTSTVRPVFKDGENCQVKHYRTISLLPILSKIFEKVIYTRIYEFFEDCELLSPNQFGYLRNRSTTKAVLTLMEHSLPAIMNNNFSLIQFSIRIFSINLVTI